MNPFEPTVWGKVLDNEIERREAQGRELAKRFPELKGLSFIDFLHKIRQAGLGLDFIRENAMHEALNEEAKEET